MGNYTFVALQAPDDVFEDMEYSPENDLTPEAMRREAQLLANMSARVVYVYQHERQGVVFSALPGMLLPRGPIANAVIESMRGSQDSEYWTTYICDKTLRHACYENAWRGSARMPAIEHAKSPVQRRHLQAMG